MKKIFSSEKDRLALARVITDREIAESKQPKNYKNCVVRKPWGYEYLMFENELAAIWALRIHAKHSTSMHCHPLKKTSLILLSGEALCNTLLHRNYLTALDALTLEKAVFHSTKALSSNGIDLIEVEVPPNKTDLVRLNDDYGREGRGYEGASEMETEDLRRFNYFYFEEPSVEEAQNHFGETYSLRMETFFDDRHFQSSFHVREGEIYCLCRGQILDFQNCVLFDTGDAFSGAFLKSGPPLKIQKKTVLLTVRQKEETASGNEN